MPGIVKVLLQQIDTGFFVGTTAPLVLEEADARAFCGSIEAVDYCLAEGIRNVEVILRFSDSQDVVLKFSDPRYDRELRPENHGERARQLASHVERLAGLHAELREGLARATQTAAEIRGIAAARRSLGLPPIGMAGAATAI